MPEGDSIHRLARRLRPVLVGKRIASLELPRSDPGGRASQTVAGSSVEAVEPRGKNLLIHLSNGWVLHTHLKMLGAWRVGAEGAPVRGSRDAISVILRVEGATLVCYRAPVARLLRAQDLRAVPDLARLGPDLLGDSFDRAEALARLVASARRPLGVALLDQRTMAGIGNVYKSELCFELRLDPFAPVARFGEDELGRLVDRARELLLANVAPRPRDRVYPSPRPRVRVTRSPHAMARGGGPLHVYDRRGLPCFRCATPIEMRWQGELLRSTYYCPTCQPSRR
jgi:endonuclease-8